MARSRSFTLAVLLAATPLACLDGAAPEPGASAAADALHGHPGGSPTVVAQVSGTTNRLQAVSPVSEKVVWVSGVGGTFGLTTDGGATWRTSVVAGAEALQFRDVEGVSARVAYLLSAGVGTDSRVYKTVDGGATWTLQFQNEDPNGFYDCFAFWTPTHGITMADAVNGRFPVIRTRDGRTWQDIGDRLPAAQVGEAAFAASGTCAATFGRRHAWLGTGGADRARVLATDDGGESWTSHDTPIVQGTGSSGVITVAFRDTHHGVIGGGELAAPTEFADTFARTRNGGRTWTLGARTPFPGSIYGLAYTSQRDDGHDGDREDGGPAVVVTGPGGAAWSADEGDSWTALPDVANCWAVAFASPRAGWLVGTEGQILKVSF